MILLRISLSVFVMDLYLSMTAFPLFSLNLFFSSSLYAFSIALALASKEKVQCNVDKYTNKLKKKSQILVIIIQTSVSGDGFLSC